MPRRRRKRARRRAVAPHISAVFVAKPKDTITAARSAKPCPKSSRRSARDHGRAHKIATNSMTPCSAGLCVAAARATASAVTVPGSHHAWRYQGGKRGLFMSRNCGIFGAELLRKFRTTEPQSPRVWHASYTPRPGGCRLRHPSGSPREAKRSTAGSIFKGGARSGRHRPRRSHVT